MSALGDVSPKKANYKVRFRHGVFPHAESQATWADIKKYDYFFGSAQVWVPTLGQGMECLRDTVNVADAALPSTSLTNPHKLPNCSRRLVLVTPLRGLVDH